jgi:hypothetical protein
MAMNRPALAPVHGMDGGSAGDRQLRSLPMQEGHWQGWFLRKGIHIGEYAILGLLFYRVLVMNRHEFYSSHALGAVCMTVTFAGLYEWMADLYFLPLGATA